MAWDCYLFLFSPPLSPESGLTIVAVLRLKGDVWIIGASQVPSPEISGITPKTCKFFWQLPAYVQKQHYTGKGDVVQTNIYLPFSLYQDWHSALNSLSLPDCCGKATERGPSLPISCWWPKKQKIQKQREQAENSGCVKYHWAVKYDQLDLNFQEPQILLVYIWGYDSLTINILQYLANPGCHAQALLKLQCVTTVNNC